MKYITQSRTIYFVMLCMLLFSDTASFNIKKGRGSPYRIISNLGVCFCPSKNQVSLISSRAQLEKMINSAQCTTHGDGEEERAEQWRSRCMKEVLKTRINFTNNAILYVGCFFSSGMITGSLEISGPENGLLIVKINKHQPDGRLTPGIGFFQSALILDKVKVKLIKMYDDKGSPLILPVK